MPNHQARSPAMVPGQGWPAPVSSLLPPSLLAAPWVALALPGITAALAVLLWLWMTPSQLLPLVAEGHGVEWLTEMLYFALAAAVALGWPAPDQLGRGRRVALAVVLAAMGAREMDLHRAWTGLSMLKVSFYLHHATPLQAVVGLSAIGLVLAAAAYLFKASLLGARDRWRRRDPVVATLAIFCAVLVVSKVLDRSVNVLAEDWGVHVALSADVLISVMEETLEATLPMLIAWGLLQHARLPARGCPQQTALPDAP